MRALAAAAALALSAVPAFAADGQPVVRDCASSAFGDLGPNWRARAVVAGPVAFVGLRAGYRGANTAPAGSGRPLKVLVVVEPRTVATLAIRPQSRRVAALHYARAQVSLPVAPLGEGTSAVRFEACRVPVSKEPWNAGTQFPGYFVVNGRRCVAVEVRASGKRIWRTLRFGAARC